MIEPGAIATAFVWVVWLITIRSSPLSAVWFGFWSVWYTVLALWALIDGDRPTTMMVQGAFAAWLAYHAWNRRKPRKRKPLGVPGRVRDLGHRLVVTS